MLLYFNRDPLAKYLALILTAVLAVKSMRSIEHLHPIAKPPLGFKPITVPVGLEEKANGQYMLDRFSRDQEKGGPDRQFKIVLMPNGNAAEVWLHEKHCLGV